MTYLDNGSPLLSTRTNSEGSDTLASTRLPRARVPIQARISAVTGSRREFLASGIESHRGVNFNIISREEKRNSFRANGHGNSREFFAAHTALTRLDGS